MHTRVVFPAVLVLFALPALGQYHDLSADWSNSSNPNGPWSYDSFAGTPLAFNPALADNFSPTQPGWGSSPPWWFKNVGVLNGYGPWDAIAGDVITHGASNVTWTSATAGTCTITGAAWMPRDIGRSADWRLRKNAALLTLGTVSSGDPYNRASPFSFSNGLGGPAVLVNVPIQPGDVIVLEVLATPNSGSLEDYVAVQLSILVMAADTLSTCGIGNVGLGSGGPYDVLTIDGSAGLPGRRVDVGTGQTFTIGVAQPPSSPGAAPFTVFGIVGVLPPATYPLPFGIGSLCFPTPLVQPYDPNLFILADSFSVLAPILPSVPAPWSITFPGGIPFPISATLQGVMLEPPGTLRITNGVILRVQ